MGNPQLCGVPSLNRCSDSNGTPDYSHENEQEDDDNHVWFYSAIGPGFLVGLLGFVGTLHYNKQWRHAYFGFLEKMGDILAMAIALKVVWLRQKFCKH